MTAKNLPPPVEPFKHDDVSISSREDLYRGYFRAEKVQFRHRRFKGDISNTVTRELFITKGAVSVLLYDPKLDAVVFVEQFRLGALDSPRSPWQLEMVAGMLDKSLPIEEIARREAMEEAGCDIASMVRIGSFFTTPGICNERFHVYAAKVDASSLAEHGGLDEEHEDIRIHVVPRQQAFAWLDDGHVENAMTVLALQWLRIHGTNW
ncbi:ADP-ribose pyrophosphatase [Permianibacter aggregans]|uniref:ADP-ribose pyrophosphatase n=1 Tax=Permianibacter aggregans TaxID=1510150 RepID=A0A4R6UMR0_9GAMM|nr:ADP-ribose pyrophosphatase [Permianibacter aggregans]